MDTDATESGWRELPKEAFDVPAPRPEFREAVWHLAAASVRRRIRRRRWLTAGALLGAYAAGAVTVTLALRPAAMGPAASAPGLARTEAAAAPRPLAVTPEMLQDTEALALALARASLEEKTALLREAGDRYLSDYGDLARATQCYRRLLDLLPPGNGNLVEHQDSWLLATLKLARQQEKAHETPHT